ncbi:condensation domain-containing protein [Streptomyces sp. NPDC054829]
MIPLSNAQRRIWFLHSLYGENAVYNSSLALRLTGPLDRTAMHQGLQDVIGRHESLRTLLVESDGEVHQKILDTQDASPRLIVEELAGRDLETALKEAIQRPFDLSSDLPLRAFLFPLGEDCHVLLLAIHHVASDGWSLGPLWKDLSAAYAARGRGHAPRWDELPVQYADYALWQRELLGDVADPQSLENRQLEFWRNTLSGLPDEIPMPFRGTRPASPGRGGISIPFSVDQDIHRAVVELAKATESTPFIVLQAAVAALFTKLGCGSDIPLGTAVAGRTDEALHDLVGFFVNSLVLRMDTTGDPTFLTLVQRARKVSLAAYAHQDLPFERLVEELNPPRVPGRHPLFQVMLTLQNNGPVDYALAGVEVAPQRIPSLGTDFDVTFLLEEVRDADGEVSGIRGMVEYATDVFTEDVAKAATEAFGTLLARLVESPRAVLSSVPTPVLPETTLTSTAAPDTASQGDDPHTTAYVAPRTPREEALCGIVADVLKQPRVGVDDNFFDLGLHSLLAMRVVSRINKNLGIQVGMKELFEYPTAALLSDHLAHAPKAGTSRPSLSRSRRS